MDNYKVYLHIFPNNKKYVGITKQEVNKRWSNGKHYKNQMVGNAIKKYGWDNIEHKIVATNLNKQDACKLEQELIKKYKSNQKEYGYNLSIGGDVGKASTYMNQEAIYFINQYNDTPEAKKIYSFWKDICKDELEAKVFNGAYSFVDKAINTLTKDGLRIEWFDKVGAINIYLEAWIKNYTPHCAEYNTIYFLTHTEEIKYNTIFDKGNDNWKLKILIGEEL